MKESHLVLDTYFKHPKIDPSEGKKDAPAQAFKK